MAENVAKTVLKTSKSRSVSFQNVPNSKNGLNKDPMAYGRKEIDRIFDENIGEKLTLREWYVII